MMKRLYYLLRGTAVIEITGVQPERILNFCAENGIEFRDTDKKDDYCLTMRIYSSDRKAVCAQSGKNGLEIKILTERGGRGLKAAVRRRAVLLIMLTAFIPALLVSSLFIWKIDVCGNSSLSTAQVLRTLEECGVSCGTFWPALSSDAVRTEVLLRRPEIAWISVNVHSSRAEVILHERIDKPEIVNESLPCDIVAAKSGIIRKMSVLEGQAAASPGDAVAAGDTLVSACMQSETGEDRLVHASAIVQADTWYEISACTPLYEQVKVKSSGSNREFSIIIGKKRINLFDDSRNKSHSCDKINRLRYISVGSAFVLPVGYAVQENTEYSTRLCPVDMEKAVIRLKATLNAELKRQINGGSIVSAEYSVSESDELMTVTLRAQCSENIAGESEYDRTNDRG